MLALEHFTGIAFIVSNSLGKMCEEFCCVHIINLRNFMWEKSCFSSMSLWGVPRRAGVNLSFILSDLLRGGSLLYC